MAEQSMLVFGTCTYEPSKYYLHTYSTWTNLHVHVHTQSSSHLIPSIHIQHHVLSVLPQHQFFPYYWPTLVLSRHPEIFENTIT